MFEDLQALSGETTIAGVARWADSEGIRYGLDSKGTLWSTVTALNVALGVAVSPDAPKLRVEDLFPD